MCCCAHRRDTPGVNDKSQQSSRPTLAKVALYARVSTATVSNVLAGKGGASPATRDRVLRAAQQVGYRVDPGARALSKGRTTSVGVLVPSSVDELIRQRQSFFWVRLLDSFVTTASDLGVTTAIVDESQGQAMVDSGIDVLVLLGHTDPYVISQLSLPFGLPVVSPVDLPNLPSNAPQHDLNAIAETVVAELARSNRQALAWMPGTASTQIDNWSNSLSEAASRAGMSFVELSHEDNAESLHSALSSEPGRRVDAIFGLFRNPRTLIEVLSQCDKKVPGDVAVIAQSEGILEEVTTPSITTLSLCGFACGEILATRAVEMARGIESEIGTAPYEMTQRESTATN